LYRDGHTPPCQNIPGSRDTLTIPGEFKLYSSSLYLYNQIKLFETLLVLGKSLNYKASYCGDQICTVSRKENVACSYDV